MKRFKRLTVDLWLICMLLLAGFAIFAAYGPVFWARVGCGALFVAVVFAVGRDFGSK